MLYLKQQVIIAENETKDHSDEALKRINNSLIACIGCRSIVSISDHSGTIYKDATTETANSLEESFSMVFYTLTCLSN